MHLVGVRSTTPNTGLVAILVEDGGPGMLAVPVTAREGIALSPEGGGRPPSWTSLVTHCTRMLGAEVTGVLLDVDADARLTAVMLVSRTPEPQAQGAVPSSPGDALVLSWAAQLPVWATEELLRLRGVDLSEETLQQRVDRWAMIVESLSAEDAAH